MSSYTLAKAAGLTTFLGNPCKRCGCCIRMVNTCACQGCENIRKENKLTAEEIKAEAILNREIAARIKPWAKAMRNVRYGEHEYPDTYPYNISSKPPLVCRTAINQWQA